MFDLINFTANLTFYITVHRTVSVVVREHRRDSQAMEHGTAEMHCNLQKPHARSMDYCC